MTGPEPTWRRYLRFWGPDARADVDDELSFHMEERIRLNEARGMTPAAARAEAERRFGDVATVRAECMVENRHAVRRAALADRIRDAVGDVRLAARSLARTPLFTATVIGALGLGVGGSAAVFTVVGAVLLEPLPYAEPDRVVAVHNRWDGTPQGRLSPAEYFDYSDRVRAFEAVGVYAELFVNFVHGDAAERLSAVVTTPSAFDVLGIGAAAGRVFDAADGVPGAPPVALLSHESWQARFNGDPAIIGREVLLNGVATTVVGVLPPGVRMPASYAADQPPAVLLPYPLDRASDLARTSHFLHGIARLAPGSTITSATAELSQVARRLAVEHPGDYPEAMRFDAWVRPVHADVAGDSRRLLLLLAAAVGLVLAVACANVAGLVLNRTEDRRREMSVRRALGAGSGRIARQLLTEHLVLAVFAAAAGLVVAQVGVHALRLLHPGSMPRLDAAGIDLRVMGFALAVSTIATLLVALFPLRFALSHADLRQSAGATATLASLRTRRLLVAGEVALCVVLVSGAGLLLRSFANLMDVNPGYRTERLLTVPVTLPGTEYADDAAIRAFMAQLTDAAADLPGAEYAGAVANLPLAAPTGDLSIRIEGRTVAEGDVSPRLDWQVVTPGWMDAMGMDLVRGRGITREDHADAPGAVVLSEAAARRHWPDGDALGQRFRLGGDAGPGEVTVVGIVRDLRQSGLADEPPAVMYLPHAQFTFWGGGPAMRAMTLVVRTAGEPMAMVTPVRDLIRSMDPHVPLGAARTMDQVVATAVAEPRFASSVLGGFALMALVLAIIGIYGMVGYAVARRSKEIAVRMAIGAAPEAVVRQFVLQGMAPVAAGAGIGVVGALALSQTVRHMLFEVAPRDPLTMLAAVAILLATALLACVVPARRAARVAPQAVLRAE